MPQGGQFGARSYRSEHEPGALWLSELVCYLAGQRGTDFGQFPDPVRYAVFGQICQIGPESVGLDGVGTRLQVPPVHCTHHVGAGDVEDLIAALQPGEVVQSQVCRLQHRAHRPIGDHDTMRQDVEQR